MAYIAYYEDADKVEAAAKARGFTGNDGESWHDFVEAEQDRFCCTKEFRDLNAAVAWLSSEIAATKSVYGEGRILERVRMKTRCAVCTCRGIQDIREWIVDNEGIEDERPVSSLCIDDED